jgi:ketosteroid isomerase-like protein
MNRKTLAAVGAALLFVASAPADDATVREVEKAIAALNKAFEKGDSKAIQELSADDHVAITPYYGGPRTRDEQIKSLPDLKLKEYRPGKLTIRPLGKDAALVTYEVTMQGTFKGRPVAERSHASAVWVRQGGQWREAYYQETALPAK